jgi:hypothetical protein
MYEAMIKALQAYEQWEAHLIDCDKAWRKDSSLPVFTEELFEELMQCQVLRNKALGKE